jgi:hypothetical protein
MHARARWATHRHGVAVQRLRAQHAAHGRLGGGGERVARVQQAARTGVEAARGVAL